MFWLMDKNYKKDTCFFFSAKDGDWASNLKLWTFLKCHCLVKYETLSQKTLSQVDCFLLKLTDKHFDWPHGLSVISFARKPKDDNYFKKHSDFRYIARYASCVVY